MQHQASPQTRDLPANAVLPHGLTERIFVHGLGCFGHARLILTLCGGQKAGRIYRVGDPNTIDLHAYVVLNGADRQSNALNDTLERHLTNEQVIARGQDITRSVFRQKWSRL